MPTTTLMPLPKQQYQTALGTPLVGGKIYTYAAGGTNPKATYTDAAGTVPHENPITLNVRGEPPAPIYWSGNYRVDVRDTFGNLIYTVDNYNTDPAGLWGLLSSAGAAVVGFLQAGANAVKRTTQDKLREFVSVTDFGAKGDGAAVDLSAFQAAIDALPALGGRIKVPAGVYLLPAPPNWGTKSIYWDIDPGATFTGAGAGQNKFPSMKTNGGQIAAGPWIQSQSRIPYTYSSPFAGGVAAYQIEMIQPADVVGQSVALYLGASGSNPDPNANVWAGNFLIRVNEGAGGTYQGIELDVDVMSDAALVKGLSINGIGTANPDVGIELIRSDATRWNTGIDIMNAIVGIKVRNTTGLQQGVIVGDPTAQSSASVNSRQLSNGGDAIILQRNADVGRLGYLLRAVDAANTTNLVTIDIDGNFTTAGIVQANHLTAKGAATAKPAGSFAIGSTNQQTVGAAGAAAALPANPRAYLVAYDGPTKVGFPYYLLP